MIRYLLVFASLGLLFWAIWSLKNEFLSKKLKGVLSLFLLLFLAFAYFYQSSFDDKSEKNMQILNAFKQGKVIKCGDFNVTNDRFNYEFGTACFVAKRNISELNGVIIEISKCKYD